jgi:hypothetical protein
MESLPSHPKAVTFGAGYRGQFLIFNVLLTEVLLVLLLLLLSSSSLFHTQRNASYLNVICRGRTFRWKLKSVQTPASSSTYGSKIGEILFETARFVIIEKMTHCEPSKCIPLVTKLLSAFPTII